MNSTAVEYDPRTETYSSKFEWSDSLTPSTAVLETVASIENVDPIELEPLYEFVDPDVLDSLFDAASSTSVQCVTFTFSGREVTVHEDGTVSIARLEA